LCGKGFVFIFLSLFLLLSPLSAQLTLSPKEQVLSDLTGYQMTLQQVKVSLANSNSDLTLQLAANDDLKLQLDDSLVTLAEQMLIEQQLKRQLDDSKATSVLLADKLIQSLGDLRQLKTSYALSHKVDIGLTVVLAVPACYGVYRFGQYKKWWS
jgi:hypothetical protein